MQRFLYTQPLSEFQLSEGVPKGLVNMTKDSMTNFAKGSIIVADASCEAGQDRQHEKGSGT